MKLSECIDPYLSRRRAGGLLYNKAEWTLAAFCRHVGNVQLSGVTSLHVLAFLNSGEQSAHTWAAKHSVLKQFFEFWTTRGSRSILIMPPRRVPAPRLFIPYIYKREEIRALLRALPASQKSRGAKIDQRTFRTLLLVLYGTGGMLGEILKLRCQDVDLAKGLFTLQGNGMIQSRYIPISSDVRALLQGYLQSKWRRSVSNPYVFVAKSGKPLSARNVSDSFRRLRKQAGIVRHDESHYGPAARDLRPTFAVHRIASWIRNKSDLNRMIPALSAYLGHASLAVTEQYLSLTPDRFRKHLMKLSPGHRKRRWRDDPVLMKFLAEL
jgi:integrase/recombinase XerD